MKNGKDSRECSVRIDRRRDCRHAAHAQITYQTLQFQNSPSTGVTGMRGDNITGSYSFPGGTGGLLYRLSTGAFEPLPEATANGSNFPGAVSSQPYGPTFGNLGGILRVTGTFVPATGQPDRSYIFDSAAAPGQQYTTRGRARRRQHHRPQPVRQPGGRQLQHHHGARAAPSSTT